MLKKERQRQIRELINLQGEVTVSELADRFGVSQMTIRRDLQDLAAQEAVEKVHGGAVRRDQGRLISHIPILEGWDKQAAAKHRIGEAAAAMVDGEDTVFIGAGTTTLAVAKAMKDRQNITVMTNALTVANTLAKSPGIMLMVTGGILRSRNLSMVGYPAERNLQGVRADKVITGIRGIDPQFGLTSDDLHEMKTNLAIMAISNHLIVVADHTKFGRVATSRTAPLSAVSVIVTDDQAPQEMVAEIKNLGVEVVLV
ncbi:MAG: DeoR/GlpR family DNA-binding transcription regulator [Anaerolineales bacterium]